MRNVVCLSLMGVVAAIGLVGCGGGASTTPPTNTAPVDSKTLNTPTAPVLPPAPTEKQ